MSFRINSKYLMMHAIALTIPVHMTQHSSFCRMDFMNMQTHRVRYREGDVKLQRLRANNSIYKYTHMHTQFLYLHITCRQFNGNVTLSVHIQSHIV